MSIDRYSMVMHLSNDALNTLASIDWRHAVGALADWGTLLALVITLVSVFSAMATRGRLHEEVHTSPPHNLFTWMLSNPGQSPVRQIAHHRIWITRTGRTLGDDGTLPLVQSLYPGEFFRVEVFNSHGVKWSGDEATNELRMPSTSGADGAVIAISWRNELIPWRRKRKVALLLFGHEKIMPSGRRARKLAKDMLASATGRDTPLKAISEEISRMNGGVLPSEESLQERYPNQLAEFHPRMLSDTAIEHSHRVQLWSGDELLADGLLNEYAVPDPGTVWKITDDVSGSTDAGYITIEGKTFNLHDSHRLRIFGR